MTAAGEFFELPEGLNHRIQYFLSSKEAARTTALSKSWRSAWLTRPNIDFDLRDFRHRLGSFSELADNTIRRYEISNLKIESFALLNLEKYWSYGSSPIPNLIVSALKLGAISLTVGITCWYFVLPIEVFSSENLLTISVKGCRIYSGPNPNAGCSRLRSLTLEHVAIRSRDMFVRIISSCPLIEELLLRHMYAFDDDDGVVVGDGGLMELRKLRSLVLDQTDVFTVFINGLSSKFPSLTDLTLCTRIGIPREEIMLISSPSLERLDLNIERYYKYGGFDMIQRVEFYLPSIRNLTFACSVIPSSAIGSPDVFEAYHHLSAKYVDFLGETLLRGLNVRILSLSRLMYGLNDLVKARAWVFDEAALMWRDVPLSADSMIPEDNQNVRFQLIWKPKQRKPD